MRAWVKSSKTILLRKSKESVRFFTKRMVKKDKNRHTKLKTVGLNQALALNHAVFWRTVEHDIKKAPRLSTEDFLMQLHIRPTRTERLHKSLHISSGMDVADL